MLTKRSNVARWWVGLVVVATILCWCSCSSSQKAPEQQTQATPKTFASPDDAAKTLVDALKSNNRDALLAIFGPQSADLIYSGDTAEDKASFAAFVSDYDAMHRFRKMPNGSQLLITGTDNKAF